MYIADVCFVPIADILTAPSLLILSPRAGIVHLTMTPALRNLHTQVSQTNGPGVVLPDQMG